MLMSTLLVAGRSVHTEKEPEFLETLCLHSLSVYLGCVVVRGPVLIIYRELLAGVCGMFLDRLSQQVADAFS